MSSYRQQGYRPQPTQQPNGRGGGGLHGNGRGAAPVRAKQKRRRKKSRPIRMFALLVLFAGLATVGVMGYMMYEEVGSVERDGTFYRGVYIDGVELYNKSPEEAAQLLYNQALQELETFYIRLAFEENEWIINADTLGMKSALDQRVKDEINKAFMVGREGNSIIERYQTIMDLQTEPYHGYTSGVEKNMAPLDMIVAQVQNAVYIAPQDASQMFDSSRNNANVIMDEANGRDIDANGLRELLIAKINDMESGDIPVTTIPIQPSVTRAMLETDMVRIADVSTPINKNSTLDRTWNVELGCSKFNDMVIQPGQTVSFNSVTGKRTAKNDYRPALEISSGEYEMGIGGGICQVSTTLYQAVIAAGLEIVERTNHGIPVNYAEPGTDATVSDNRHDFRFRNNTDKPIRIVARVVSEGKTKRCMFQIYGRPIPGNVSYSLKPVVEEIIPIPDPTTVPDYKQEHVLYMDETKQTFKGQEGLKVRTYLVTKDPGGAVLEEKEISFDTYKPMTPRIYVGVERRPQ